MNNADDKVVSTWLVFLNGSGWSLFRGTEFALTEQIADDVGVVRAWCIESDGEFDSPLGTPDFEFNFCVKVVGDSGALIV